MKYSVSVCVLLAILAGAWAQVARYDNYKVFRMIPRTDAQLALLREFEGSAIDYDMWKGPSRLNVPVDVMVPPHKSAEFAEVVKAMHIEAKPYIENVQELLDENTPSTKANRAFGWTDYYNGEEINAWLDSLAANYPDTVSVVVVGKSYEGRDIKGVKVSFKEGNKGVFLEAGIHAREWIAPATVTYMLNELLTSEDPAVREVAETYDWYVFPSANPDGYAYTFSRNRLWRKTRQPYGFCVGADPNRNWGYHWMNGGASNQPCSDTYAGSSAFSEPETKALSDYISTVAKDLVAYFGFHSYSQLLLIPYGDSGAHVENYDELYEIGMKAASKLAQRFGTKYTVGNIVDVIYVASGGSMDWVKGNYQTPITYTYELRDTGRHGFVLPKEQIIPTSEETMDSFISIMQDAIARGYK